MRHKARSLALLLVSAMLFVLGAPSLVAANTSHPFDDIRGSSYEARIATLYNLGIVTGMEANKYGPTGGVTRAQMATFIIRALGMSAEADMLKSTPTGFNDVSADHWGRGFISLANRKAIIKGDGTNFFPNDPVNYAQAVTMLVRAGGYENQVVGGYPNGYVIKANELGLLQGVNFQINEPVNRAEAAAMLYNAVFRMAMADSGQTLSQRVFKQAATLKMEALPSYAAPGEQLVLTATAADEVGKPIADAPVQFSVISGSGSIQNNRLTVGQGAAITVQASLGSLTARATVTPVESLIITPDTFRASKGGTVQLSATARAQGSNISVKPTWQVVQGPAQVDSNGLLTVTDYGAVKVQATLGSLTATAAGEAVGKVSITNKPAYLAPGQSFTFQATASDTAGNAIQVPVTWSAIGASIDSTTGRILSVTGQEVIVKATAGGVTEQVTVPVLKSIVVTPANVNILTGKQVNFTAKGVDASGRQYDISPTWDRTVAGVGIIDGKGTFAGTGSGTTQVTAAVGSLVGRADLRVSGSPVRLAISTDANSVPAGSGASVTVTIKLLDATGAVSAVDDQPISLTVTPEANGTLSKSVVLTRQGEATVTFTPSMTAGYVTITASAPGTTFANQTIGVSTYPQHPTYIQITATPQPLATGGGVATVTATLKDATNFPAKAPQTLYVSLTANSPTVGSLTGTTITIPAGATSGSISFISGSLPGSVQIGGTSSYPVTGMVLQTANVGPAAGVKIRPIQGVTPVTGLSSLQVQVDVVDSAGVSRAHDNTTQVQLTVSAPSGLQGGQTTAPQIFTQTARSGVATFQVPALGVGTVTLSAGLVGGQGSMDTATAEFVPGVFSSLRLRTGNASLAADGTSQTQIIAEVMDRSNNVLTNVNPVITFRKLVDGGATNPLTEMTVQSVGGQATLTVQATRAAASDQWYAAAPGMETQNLVTVSTTASSGDAWRLEVVGTTSYSVNQPGAIVLRVVDQQGRQVLTDNGRTVTAHYSLPGVTVTPSSAITQGGTLVFSITGTQSTSGIITFTAPGLPNPTTTVSVTVGSGSSGTGAHQVRAQAVATSSPANSQVTVNVQIVDAQGNIVTSDSGRQITATVTGPGYTQPQGSTTTVNGVGSFAVIGYAAGTVTVQISAPGLPQPTATVTINFTN